MNKFFTFVYRYYNAKQPEIGMKLDNKKYNEYDNINVYRMKLIMKYLNKETI